MKKQKVLAVLLLMMLFMVQAVPAFALTSTALVNDECGLLSMEEVQQLEARADAIQAEYGLSVRVVVVPSMMGQTDAYEYAKTLYNQYFAGADAQSKGMMMLMLSMENRDYALIANREGNSVLTDYGNEKMADSFLTYFGEDDWMGGFEDYLNTADDYCHQFYVEGKAYDYDPSAGWSKAFWILAVVGSPIIALMAVSVMIKGMKTAKKQTHAEMYIGTDEGDAFTLHGQSDDYLYSQTIVTPRVKIDDDNFGGGTTIDAGGFSGSSGKF